MKDLKKEIIQVTFTVTLFTYNDECSEFEITEYSKSLDLSKNYHLKTLEELKCELNYFADDIKNFFVDSSKFVDISKNVLLNNVSVYQESTIDNYLEFVKHRSLYIK